MAGVTQERNPILAALIKELLEHQRLAEQEPDHGQDDDAYPGENSGKGTAHEAKKPDGYTFGVAGSDRVQVRGDQFVFAAEGEQPSAFGATPVPPPPLY